jgi:uncharacterized protein YggT (Ycf19 family)
MKFILEFWAYVNYVTVNLLYIFFKIYSLAVELRLLLQFFLQFNPYNEPLLTLWVWTNPMFNFGRRFYPRLIGLDLCSICNTTLLSYLTSLCNRRLKRYNAMQEFSNWNLDDPEEVATIVNSDDTPNIYE